jgi:hypothetical protein
MSRLGFWMGLGLLSAFSASNWAWAARQPDPRELAELRLAIEQVARVRGVSGAAFELQWLFEKGRIQIEDGWPDWMKAETDYPLWGDRTIRVHARLVPRPADPEFGVKYGRELLFERRADLASTLVHEWLHTKQSKVFAGLNRFTRGNIEIPAYLEQRDYLKALQSWLKGREKDPVLLRSLLSRIDTIIDAVEAEARDYGWRG